MYGAPPLETVKFIAPLLCPEHATFVAAVAKFMLEFSLTKVVLIVTQPSADVTVTVYAPADKPMMSSVDVAFDQA